MDRRTDGWLAGWMDGLLFIYYFIFILDLETKIVIYGWVGLWLGGWMEGWMDMLTPNKCLVELIISHGFALSNRPPKAAFGLS